MEIGDQKVQRTDQEETHMYEVDARGLSCPEPLMLVSDALKSHPGEKLKVLVSEPHSRTNVEKRAYRAGKRDWFGVRTDDRRIEINEAKGK